MGAANPVDIIGAGQGTSDTVLRSPNALFALDIQSPGSTVSNLRVRVENQGGMYESGIGLSAAGVVADGVTVLGEPGVDNAVAGVVRPGAILRNSLVQVPVTSNANKAISAAAGARVENVAAAGDTMVDARNAGAAVVVRRRALLHSVSHGDTGSRCGLGRHLRCTHPPDRWLHRRRSAGRGHIRSPRIHRRSTRDRGRHG